MDYRRRCPTPNSSSNQRPITNRNSRPEGGSPNAKRDTRNDGPLDAACCTSPAGDRSPAIALLPVANGFWVPVGDLAAIALQPNGDALLRGFLPVPGLVTLNTSPYLTTSNPKSKIQKPSSTNALSSLPFPTRSRRRSPRRLLRASANAHPGPAGERGSLRDLHASAPAAARDVSALPAAPTPWVVSALGRRDRPA